MARGARPGAVPRRVLRGRVSHGNRKPNGSRLWAAKHSSPQKEVQSNGRQNGEAQAQKAALVPYEAFQHARCADSASSLSSARKDSWLTAGSETGEFGNLRFARSRKTWSGCVNLDGVRQAEISLLMADVQSTREFARKNTKAPERGPRRGPW